MVRSDFVAFDCNGKRIFGMTIAAKGFESHDKQVDLAIRHAKEMGATRFQIVSK